MVRALNLSLLPPFKCWSRVSGDRSGDDTEQEGKDDGDSHRESEEGKPGRNSGGSCCRRSQQWTRYQQADCRYLLLIFHCCIHILHECDHFLKYAMA